MKYLFYRYEIMSGSLKNQLILNLYEKIFVLYKNILSKKFLYIKPYAVRALIWEIIHLSIQLPIGASEASI